ncbi:hypothetical protein HN51_004028 [Arachis hypogaea]|uniref:Uncharacterized protein LOC107483031 n=2 Tax=Arachis TaxID=3817 RepID=A0A6P4D4F3_ARADU|nr:uncharacterized protein LOC107483031 [Arachis duranensis]XP_025692079.1 uncharacterized protein LOC112794182 [Arachis hypogaea]
MMPLTTNELHLFHKTDRALFCRLMFKQNLSITQALLVMGVWLWLEYTNYPNIISTMMQLSDSLVKSLSNEALTCLDTLAAFKNPPIPKDGGLPLTKILVQKDITLKLFIMKRYTAIAGIKSVLNNICARVFKDILQNILSTTYYNYNYNYNNYYKYNYNYTNVASTSRARSSNSRPFVVPGFPHPLFGDFVVPNGVEDLDLLDAKIWSNKGPCDDVTEEDKTMFITFSRGFPVSEEEVRELFITDYGYGSVVEIVMGNYAANNQSMFATMVLNGVAMVDEILQGLRLAKLRANGKDIWVRKYDRRN